MKKNEMHLRRIVQILYGKEAGIRRHFEQLSLFSSVFIHWKPFAVGLNKYLRRLDTSAIHINTWRYFEENNRGQTELTFIAFSIFYLEVVLLFFFLLAYCFLFACLPTLNMWNVCTMFMRMHSHLKVFYFFLNIILLCHIQWFNESREWNHPKVSQRRRKIQSERVKTGKATHIE